MNPKLNPRFLRLILPCLLLLGIPSCICQNDNLYQTCNEPFQCGTMSGIRYPFYGGIRPLACGYPGFELTCQPNTHPLLTISSIVYRVLEIDNSSRILRVARNDLWNTLCPTTFLNTTLDSTPFDLYSSANDQNITLYYGCSGDLLPPTQREPNQFGCGNGVGLIVTRGVVPIPPLNITCSDQISVLVNEGASQSSSTPILLQAALQGGFWIQYSADDDNCNGCRESGGLCGYHQNATSFACHCTNAAAAASGSTCNAGNGNGTSGLKIGLPIAGAVLAGIGFAWLIFYFRQRRKQRIERLGSQSTQTESKKLSGPSSSIKPLSSPTSTNFTTSIPSYPSSKSDFGMASTYFGVQVFSYTELEEATNNFDPSRELGDGGFGTVYYGELPDGRIVAVKRLYENNFKRVEQFMNEVEILTRLRHDNLVKLYGCTSKRSRELLLVYEYISNGTVADHLNGNRSKSGLLSWPIRLNIAIETACALAYLHKSDIIHRDVKTNNILLDNDFHVKVADFGLSRLFPTDVTHVSTAPQGTPGYVDPEYYQCYQLTEKSDVYSFGVVLIELISSLPAVDTNRHRHDINLANMAVNKIQNHTLHELVDSSLGFETNSSVRRMATLVAELAFRCLQQERDMRPSMEEALEALRIIQNEDLNAHRVEIVDILVDDDAEGLMKGGLAPPSPESVTTEKSGRGSTPNSV